MLEEASGPIAVGVTASPAIVHISVTYLVKALARYKHPV